MKFCPDCGTRLSQNSANDELRQVWFCSACRCERRDYPGVMLTCFVSCGTKLLWIRRRLEPKAGLWAIPGGYMESGETSAAGAARELWEEAGVRIAPTSLEFYMTGTITFINQVYIAYRASVANEHCYPGSEAMEAAFFARDQCPWAEVAYPEVNDSIRCAYDDLERGEFAVYQAQMSRDQYRLEPVVTKGWVQSGS